MWVQWLGEGALPSPTVGLPEARVFVTPDDEGRLVGEPPQSLLDFGQQLVRGQDLPRHDLHRHPRVGDGSACTSAARTGQLLAPDAAPHKDVHEHIARGTSSPPTTKLLSALENHSVDRSPRIGQA
jgi:hypothetical protein